MSLWHSGDRPRRPRCRLAGRLHRVHCTSKLWSRCKII